MSNTKQYVLVLWGDGFDEAVATILITELRELGLLVKVVGLAPGQINGARGLALVSDYTLDQALALAPHIISIIIPAVSRWGENFKNDPRLPRLLEQTLQNKATLVIGDWDDTTASHLGLPTPAQNQLIIYPAIEDLVQFARDFAESLLTQLL